MNKTKPILLKIVFIFMFIYIFVDLSNSAIIGQSNQNRTAVYIMIGLLLILTLARLFLSGQKFLNAIEITLALMALWIILNNVLLNTFNWASIIHIGLSLLWFGLYNFFSRYNYMQEKVCTIFFTIFFLIYVCSLFISSFQMRDGRDAVLNTSYYVLIFLPVLLSFSRKKYTVITCALLIIGVFWSFKRGAILAMFFMFFMYFFVQKKVTKTKNSMLKFICIATVAISILFALDNYFGGIILERFSKDNLLDGSGRKNIYTTAFAYLETCDFATLLIGSGAGTTARILDASAHNEWIEFIMCYGLIGVFIYLMLFVALIKQLHNMIKAKNKNAIYFGIFLAYLFIVGFYGQIYFIQSTIFVMSMLGFYSRRSKELVI